MTPGSHVRSAICTVAYGERYVPYGDRLVGSLRRHGWAGGIEYWRNEWPPESPPHSEANYFFKWFALESARRKGYERVLWLDSHCYAVRPVDPIFSLVSGEGHYLVSGDDLLGEWIGDVALSNLKMSREEAMSLRLLAGAIVGLDLGRPVAMRFFDLWRELGEAHLFMGVNHDQNADRMRSLPPMTEGERVSLDPRVKGHRSDEACLTVVAHRLKMRSHDIRSALFSGGFGKREDDVLRCGYDL
jgi:hypothetical protein